MSLASGSDELRVLLKGLNGQTGGRMSAVVTRSGVPVAWVLPPEVPPDNFATMAATLLGALEVIYSTMNGPAPQTVSVRTENGTLAVRLITSKMFLVALSSGEADLAAPLEEAATRARGILAKGS